MKSLQILCVILFFFALEAKAQDSIPQVDSVKIGYKKLEDYSNKTKVGKFLHRLVFRSTNSTKVDGVNQLIGNRNFVANERKIIRNIEITTLDPIGYSVLKPEAEPTRPLSKFGNAIHAKTKKRVIKNFLLFDIHQELDSLKVLESERIIRSQRFIRSVRTEPIPVPGTDSVDIVIRVLDSWSLVPNIQPSTNRITYDITERNVLGWGHEWDNSFRQNLKDNRTAFSTRYTLPNVGGSLIRSQIRYRTDLNNNYVQGIEIERTFVSPLTRWAGGVLTERRYLRDSIPGPIGEYELQPFKTDVVDLWVGHSFPLEQGLLPAFRTTNVLATFRYLNLDFRESPERNFDPENFFAAEQFYIGGLGISSRQYVQDKFIFNFNIIEDVPIGKYLGLNMGYQKKNHIGRLYLGAKATYGNYFKWGYFSTNFEFGSFYRDNRTVQNAWVNQINYFSPIFNVGTWRIRQFLKSDLIIGNRRANSVGDRININQENGLIGFEDLKLLGTKKWVVSFQTQSYSPWQWAGFRISPFANYSLAVLGNDTEKFIKSSVYNKLSLGVILTNDYLVFNSIQLSVSYFPVISNQGINLFQFNSFRTSDFGYLDFEINKPRTVLYQ